MGQQGVRISSVNRKVRWLLFLLVALALKGQSLDSKTIFPSDTRAFAQTEDKDLIQTVCPGHVEKGGKVDSGKICPSSSGLDMGQHIFDWSLVRITRGYFLSSASDDAVVSTVGCEPHSENGGGSILLTHRGEKWEMQWYKPGVDTSRCHKVQLTSGREILVCLGASGAQGNIATELYEEDLLRPRGSLMAGESDIFAVVDNTLACGFYDETSILKHALLEKIDFAKAPGGHEAMSVTFSMGPRKMTPEATDACNARLPRRSLFIPPMRRYTINFVFDGHNFEPTSSSAALEKRLGLK